MLVSSARTRASFLVETLARPLPWLLIAAGQGLSACGGAPALLQPAHPLPSGVVEYGAGVATNVALGSTDDDIARAQTDPDPSRSGDRTKQWLRGAYQKSVIAPGVSPWIGARAGLGDGNEGQLVYTGRNLRVGARHAWLWDDYALSLGGGLSSVLGRRAVDQPAGEGLPAGRVEWPGRGFGLDVPLSFGWSSQSELLQAWFGLRGAFEALYGDLPYGGAADEPPPQADAQAYHWQTGGFIGLSVGVSPVWVRAELDATWHRVDARATLPSGLGSETERDAFSGFGLAPAGAILVQF